MLRRLTSTSSSWATVPLRLALGTIFIAHGAQKVFGAWSGPGLGRFTSFPAPFPFMRPAWVWMGLAAFSEMIGVHWRNGFFLSPTAFGIEYTVALIGVALALLIAGGGQASIDRLIGGRR